MSDSWFADLIDSIGAPSGGGKAVLRRTKDKESYVLVARDVISTFPWTEASVNETPKDVAKAFDDILQRAGKAPRSVTSDLGPEFEGLLNEC